jgi:hypothetical protein
LNAASESSDSPRVQGESKNAGAEDTVEAVRHFALVATFVIEFGASRDKSRDILVVSPKTKKCTRKYKFIYTNSHKGKKCTNYYISIDYNYEIKEAIY